MVRYNDFVLSKDKMPGRLCERGAHGARGICSIMKLTAKQIARLVKQGEIVQTECKDASGGLPDSLWESYSSFANTDGGRSDPRNAQVFNIFSLIGIGERSGTGLSNLYALWEQHGFATPLIREEFDPEKTIVSISTGLDNKLDNKSDLMSSLDNNSQVPQAGPRSAQGWPKLGPKSAQDPTKTRPRPDRSAPEVPQKCPKGAPRCPKGAPRDR